MSALMYHDVVASGEEDTSGFPGRDAAFYKVTPERFDAHLDAIVGATAARGAGPAIGRGLTITFDDGGVSAMRAAEALERHGLAGHFFVTTNYIGAPGFVTRSDIRELARRGHAIGSHSCSHPLRMAHCDVRQLADEWTRSRGVLTEALEDAASDVRTASVPGGDFATRVAEAAAQAGYTTLFTSEPTRAVRHAFGVTIAGRFAIRSWTTAETAAALAAGRWLASARQAVVWNAMKMTKRVGGERYLRLRRRLLRSGRDVRWGDRLSRPD
jgi:peptidoglycan/xylan/chitin deacetylase (PgdA/CDA1 family)